MSLLSSKNIYQEQCGKSNLLHKLNGDERRQLQSHLCKMYKDLEKVCEKHELSIMLACGSALGAVRHHGFIPWDDDLDVFMPRTDYEKLINEFSDELPDNYIIYAPNSKNGAIARFAKMVDTSTVFIEVENENIDRHAGVFIDIFPLDSLSTSKFKNIFNRVISMMLIYVSGSVVHYQAHSEIYKSLMCGSRSGWFNYHLRQLIGLLFSFFGEQRLYNIVDKFCRNIKRTGYVDFVQSSYRWIPLNESLFLPPVKGVFEGIQVYLPHKTIKYLEIEYGDWDKLPPENERPEHYVVDFKL